MPTKPKFRTPQEALRYHVTGAIERGEGQAIVEIPPTPANSQPPAAGQAAHVYSAEYGRSTIGDAMPVYLKKNGVVIAEMSARDNSSLKASDASEIVRACNSHAALSNPLPDMEQQLSDAANCLELGDANGAMLCVNAVLGMVQQARAALASVRQ